MRATPQKIVVGIDGSPGSSVALDWAVTEARLRRCPLVLAHAAAADPIALTSGASAVAGRTPRPDYVDDAVERITGEEPGMDVSALDLVGSAASALIHLSAESTMVVVGARGRSRVAEVLLGSVSRHVATHAHCPAVVVRGARPKATWPVAVGVDGSAGSALALREAAVEATLREVTLLVVHAWQDVTDTGYGVWTAPADVRQAQERGAEDLTSEMVDVIADEFPDLAVLMRVAQSHPVSAMLAASAESQLVVVGAHGRGVFPGMGIGSVSSAVLHSSTCPVLLVPTPR